jgi:hypothetical protein
VVCSVSGVSRLALAVQEILKGKDAGEEKHDCDEDS